MICSDCQLKYLAERHSFYFPINKGSGAHNFCILHLCTYTSILLGGEKCRGSAYYPVSLIQMEVLEFSALFTIVPERYYGSLYSY